MKHDQEFIQQIKQNPEWRVHRGRAEDGSGTIQSSAEWRPLDGEEIGQLLDFMEEGYLRDEEISYRLAIPLRVVTEIGDLWEDTYLTPDDPEPEPDPVAEQQRIFDLQEQQDLASWEDPQEEEEQP